MKWYWNCEATHEAILKLWGLTWSNTETLRLYFQKISKKMKLTWSPPAARLTIYRVAHQALATDMSHPILPLIWQRFFDLYLQRPVTQPGSVSTPNCYPCICCVVINHVDNNWTYSFPISLPQRAGVGYRFFESQASVSLLKKMKHRLQATAEHHRTIASQTNADHETIMDSDREVNKQFEETRAFHEKLVRWANAYGSVPYCK